MFKIWNILNYEFKKKSIFILLLILIGIVLEAFSIGLVLPVITVASSGYDSLPEVIKNTEIFNKFLAADTVLFYAMIFFICFFTIRTAVWVFTEYIKQKFIYSLQENLSSRIFSGYLNNDYNFFLKSNSSTFIRNIITEIGILANVTQSFLILISEVLLCVSLFILMAYVEPMGTSIALLIFTIGAISFYITIKKKVSTWGTIRHEFDGYRIKNLQQAFGSIKEIIITNKQKYFLESFVDNTHVTMEAARKQNTVQQIPRLLLELLTIVGIAIISFVLIAQNQDTASIASVLALFAASAFRLMPSINRILSAAQTMRYAKAVTETISQEILKFEKIPSKSPSLLKLDSGNIELKNLSFYYDNKNEKVLHDINLRINSNSTVAFIGASGSGKSTLIDIILGVLKPTHGSIVVNDKNLEDIISEWQNSIGYVPQDIYLTDESLRENIAFGVKIDQINDSRVEDCINLANLDTFVSGLPKGLETKVGERGVRISGGQLQRVGIARALYNNPSVLILDEATSALDSLTEKKIMDAVFSLSGNMTIIIIAHRLSTIESCDYVYKLDNGFIISHGSPKDVIYDRSS